jgi:signal transduction histidine kinase
MITGIVIIIIIACFALGGIGVVRNPKKILNVIFFIFTTTTGLWIAANYFSAVFQNAMLVDALVKADFSIGILLANLFLLLTMAIGTTNNKKLLRVLALTLPVSIIMMFLVATNQVINIIHLQDGIRTSGNGLLNVVYQLVLGLYVLLGICILYIKRRRSRGVEKDQITIMLFGLFVTSVFVLTTNVILPLFINSVTLLTAIQQLSYSGIVFFIAMTAFAIIRHKLFDVKAVVARSFAYLISITVIGLVYGFVAFRFAGVFLQHSTLLVQQSFYTILAIVLAFTFSPLRRFFEKISNKVFYRDRYDAQELVNEVGRILAGEIQLDELCHKVITELTKQMKLSSADIVVIAEKNVHFQTRVFSSEQHEILVDDLTKLGRLVIVTDDLNGGERKAVLQKYHISMSLALRTSEEFLGYLLLGEKKSGSIYNDVDVKTLKIIANELSVGLQNAKAFAEIQAFNETLQAKVNDATKRLRHANSELKELDEAKDEFISIASHQLRTPLTTVKGYASMISEGDFGKLTTKQKEPVSEILDGSERMNRLVGDLLNVSRIQAGKFYIDTVEIDFEQLVAGEVKQLEQLAKSKKVELVYKPPAKKLAPMMLDQNKTEQAVMNLIDNAIHYSASPGGGHVQVSLEVHGNEVVFLVRDDGIGVPRDKQAKLFTKMFRADNAKEVRPDGTGLGLYLVKRVVEDEGGHVVFASEPGKGSTFGFRLPIGGVPKELQQKAKSIAKHVHLSV